MKLRATLVLSMFSMTLLDVATSTNNSQTDTGSHHRNHTSGESDFFSISSNSSSALLPNNSLYDSSKANQTSTNTTPSQSASTSNISPTTLSTRFPLSHGLPTTSIVSSSLSSSPPTSSTLATSPATVVIVILVLVLLLLLLFCLYRAFLRRQSDQNNQAPRLLLGVRERMRGGVKSLEERLGFSLWPGGKLSEDGEEEGEGDGDVEAKGKDVEAGLGGMKEGVRVEEDEEDQEDQGDSSDDYSSLEGMDLRERAKKREEKQQEKEENQGGAKGGESEGSKGRGDSVIRLVSENDDVEEPTDFTVL